VDQLYIYKFINMYNNFFSYIKMDPFDILLKRLSENDPTLQTIDLSDDPIEDAKTITLAHALGANTTLQTLNLSVNNITNTGAIALAHALGANTSLQTLGLTGNEIGDNGVIALAHALKTNTTLRHLSLGVLGDAGAIALAEALKTNNHLQKLDLSSCLEITDEGAIELAKALKTNTTLRSLSLLAINRIGDEGAIKLADALKTNTTLRHLSLSINRIGNTGAKALADALRKNETLQALDLGSGFNHFNPISELVKKTILARTQYNILLDGLKKVEEFCKKKENKEKWDFENGPLCHAKKYNTLNTLASTILSYDNDKDNPIFIKEEKKRMNSCLQPLSLPANPELFNIYKTYGIQSYIPAYMSKNAKLTITRGRADATKPTGSAGAESAFLPKKRHSTKKFLGRKQSPKKSLGRKQSPKKSLGRKTSTKKSLGHKKSTKKSLGRKRRPLKKSLGRKQSPKK
jgi:Ran GTPase-activating protein (RanGAP) involved in mRNA processing and transport